MAGRECQRRPIRTKLPLLARLVAVSRAVVVVLVVVCASTVEVAVGFGRTHSLRAPPTSALRLTPGAKVIASAPGGSAVDTGYDHKRYRYMAVAGIEGERRATLLASEVRFLAWHGWKDELSYVLVAGSDPVAARRVPVTRPGANVLINAPHRKLYAALDAIESWRDAEQQTDGTPLYNTRAIRRALAHHEPVLFVTLGNGRHGRV
jgi:hypothetical protein